MIHSMTGFGEAKGKFEKVTYSVEIKTLNNRYLKTMIKLPESASFLEKHIERLLRENLARGTVNYTLRIKDASAGTLLELDEAALRNCLRRLQAIASSSGDRYTIEVTRLLDLPGIAQSMPADEAAAEHLRQRILAVSTEALNKLKRMRGAEGTALAADMKNNCDLIRENLTLVRQQGDAVLKHYRQKLKARVDALLADGSIKLDEDTLTREIALYADRSDISEEITRLHSHLEQFIQVIDSDSQAGRKLEFISQEMLREANTIASKALDENIGRWVVDMKCRIDRLKEQAANVE
jgi:uncharacterized protein (TIGR00255 family)